MNWKPLFVACWLKDWASNLNWHVYFILNPKTRSIHKIVKCTLKKSCSICSKIFNVFDHFADTRRYRFRANPANIYLFRVNNRKNRKWYEMCSKLTIKWSFWQLLSIKDAINHLRDFPWKYFRKNKTI